jgi:hypothetical protein
MRGIAKFITLYVALVITSGAIIALALDTHWLAALGTASVGCVFKTIAAHAHSWVWSKWQEQPANVNEYDVELVPFPCPCPEAEAA